ncbi:MAG: dihydrodipicolinate reductase [Clostridia bacterium]|nr:dihydrodipicolinate reductase [Clostridium sp.]
MERKIRVAQYGAGKMSIYTMRYVYEKGGEIVAAIDINPNVIGKDIGEVMGTENKGVKVETVENAEKVLKETHPDIVIVTTMSLIKDVEDALTLCAKLGINAITTCEEAFFPANSNPQITNKLDEIAKTTNCTITGSGYQDIYWGQLISSIAGSTHKITKIKGSSSYNVEDYGIALAQAHGSGLSLEEFDEQVAALDRISDEERNEMINKGEYLPSYMWNVNGWLCAKLGLTVKSQTQKTVPQTYDKDIKSDTLGMVVKAGTATGMSAVVTTETEEGITLETQCIGKVYSEEDFDKNEWTIEGEPNTTLIINRPSTVELTCASVVNRIPDVINSKAGYVPTEEMGELNYRIKPLNEYVK